MTETSLPRAVGVIGLGIMGGAMARNLTLAGFAVTGSDLDEARRKELAADGIAVTGSAQAIAEMAAAIVTSLPSAAALKAVVAVLAGATDI